MTAHELLSQLDGVRPRGTGKWSARCIAHQDNNPSLSVSEGKRGLLVKCWAGCTLDEITGALGIEVKDLFFDAPSPHGQRLIRRPAKIDYTALAFRYELAALDRRLRADNVLKAVNNITINEFSDHDLDRLVDAVGRAYADIDRAELFEGVADDLQLKEFSQRERRERHAAQR